jgi:hypothetical protein
MDPDVATVYQAATSPERAMCRNVSCAAGIRAGRGGGAMVKVVWLAEGRIGSHADCHSTKRQPVPKGLVMRLHPCARLVAKGKQRRWW